MKLEKVLFQKSHFYLLGFSVFVIIAFWLTYITEVFNQESYWMHIHGLAMFLWCALLITQPYLISKRKNALHRQLGKASYMLVALIAFSTIGLYKFRLSTLVSLTAIDYLATSSVLIALLVFLTFYWLAIYFRKKTAIHGRYMICTVFAMFTAVIDRIIRIYFPDIVSIFPIVDGENIVQVLGLTLGDIILLGLCIWDWQSHKRWNVFPIALGIHLAYHYAVLNFYKFDFWKNFCLWLYNF